MDIILQYKLVKIIGTGRVEYQPTLIHVILMRS